MSRVLTVKRGGGRGWPALIAIALLVAIALFHETLARALGGPAERLRLLLGKTSAWDLGICLCAAAQEVTVVRDDGLKLAATERLADPADRKQFWHRARANREILGFEPFPAWYTEDVWRRHKESSSDLGNYAPYFAAGDISPSCSWTGRANRRRTAGICNPILERWPIRRTM